MSDDPPPPKPVAAYRLSDGERDEAISALADAYAEGRLDVGEFDARMTAASEATYATQLDPLFEDLPTRPRTRSLAVASPREQRTAVSRTPPQRLPMRGAPVTGAPGWGAPGWGAPRWGAPRWGSVMHRAPMPWMLVPMIVVLFAVSSGAWVLIPIVVVVARHRLRAAHASAAIRQARMDSQPGRRLPCQAPGWSNGRSCH